LIKAQPLEQIETKSMKPILQEEQAPKRKNKLRFLPIVLFFIFIIWIIVQADLGIDNPFVQFVHQIPWGDKIGHIFIFACLTFLLNHALSYASFKLFRVKLLTGSMLIFCFALAEEFTQLFFPTRTFDFGDILSDLVGIIFASVFAYQRIIFAPK
jgi:VanZ family protein